MPKKRNRRQTIIGLTGGIGSGKSTVLTMMKNKGAVTFDSDQIVAGLLRDDPVVLRRIKNKFGEDVFDRFGRLDKKKLADRVFGSKSSRKILEQLLHPRVRKLVSDGIKKTSGPIVVVDVPLLFETGWNEDFDLIVVVTSRTGVRRARLLKKGFTASDIGRRMKAQWPLIKKERLADFVINNNGSIQQTRNQVMKLWRQIQFTK